MDKCRFCGNNGCPLSERPALWRGARPAELGRIKWKDLKNVRYSGCEGKQLTVVNPAVALSVALQGIAGIVLFLVRHKYENQRAATTLLYGYPLSHAFVSLSHLRFISIYPVFPVLSRSSLNSLILAQLRAIS
jgi:hypothetical protein